jgi:KTSC domain-containing protein
LQPRGRAKNKGSGTMRRALELAIITAAGVVCFASTLRAESVDVKYRGRVDLKPFACTNTESSFVKRVCYDRANAYMLISLNGTYYHYCEIDGGTVSALLSAESKGRYYNASVKGRFDCRVNRVPTY